MRRTRGMILKQTIREQHTIVVQNQSLMNNSGSSPAGWRVSFPTTNILQERKVLESRIHFEEPSTTKSLFYSNCRELKVAYRVLEPGTSFRGLAHLPFQTVKPNSWWAGLVKGLAWPLCQLDDVCGSKAKHSDRTKRCTTIYIRSMWIRCII